MKPSFPESGGDGPEYMLGTDLRQDELLHWFVPHPVHQGPCADGTEASSDHGLLQEKHKLSSSRIHECANLPSSTLNTTPQTVISNKDK